MIHRIVTSSCIVASLLFPTGCGSLIVTDQSVQTLRDRPGFAWTAYETDACTVRTDPGSAQVSELSSIAGDAIESKRRILDALEIPAYDERLSIFLVDSRDRMKDLVGRRTNATGYHTSNVLCIVWPRSGRSGLRHEMTHVIAMNEWGVPRRWFNEGLAVDITGPWIGRDVEAVCKVLRSRDELPSLADLMRRFNALPSAVSYPAAGSFVRMLRETYGIGVVRAIWKDGDRSLTKHTGRTRDELEAAWVNRIEAASADGVTYDPQAVTPSDDR